MKLTDLLATPQHTQVKHAGAETPDNQQVEQDFGRLAYSFLKDRAPALLPFLIGFEIVEQEPDGSRAVGIFGFRINQNFYYVPAFFLSNQIKGMDLLYSKNEKVFYPLQEGWINHIISKQNMTLGKAAPRHAKDNFAVPDFTFISRPPTGGSTKLSEVVTNLPEAWNEMQREVVESLNGDPKFADAFSGSMAVVTKSASSLRTSGSTTLTDFLENHGGPKMVATVLNTMQNPAFLKAASVFYDYKDLMISKFAANLEPKVAKSKIQVVTEKEVRDYDDDKVKYRVVRDGFAVVDDRDTSEKSEVYKVDYLTSVSNPSNSGNYRMIMQSGASVPVCVSKSPYGVSDFGSTLVIEPTSGRWFLGDNNKVHVREDLEELDKDDDTLYKKAIKFSDMKISSSYVLVNEKGDASLPFRLKSLRTEDGELCKLEVDWKYGGDGGCAPCDDSWDEETYYRETATGGSRNPRRIRYDDKYLIPVDRGGGLTKSKHNTIVPTADWKAFKIEDIDDYDYEDRAAARDAFQPASYLEVCDSLTKLAFHNVRVESRDQGIDYNIYVDEVPANPTPFTLKSATLCLVKNLGFGPLEAEEAIKEAATQYKAKRLVRFPVEFADEPVNDMGDFLPKSAQVSMPNFPQQTTSYDSQLNVPVQPEQYDYVTGQPYGIPQQNQNVGPGSGANIGGEASMQQGGGGLPDNAVNMAQQAAQSGQQQVFDHAIIGGLAKTYDTSAAVDSYIPELSAALDRIGRIIFLFYWKNADFAERYGDQDLTGMEDHLRAVFKSLGDLVLSLKQKTIDTEESEYVPAN